MRRYLVCLGVAAVALAMATFGDLQQGFGLASHGSGAVHTELAVPGPGIGGRAVVQGDAVPVQGPKQIAIRALPLAPNEPASPKAATAIPFLAPKLRSANKAKAPPANALGNGGGQTLGLSAPADILSSFDGLDSTDNAFGLTPPDPQIAVGPSHVVEFVNVVGRITDKSGVPAGPDFTLASFFGVPAGNFDFDPKIIYDDISGRFFAVYASTDPAGDGFLHVAVSQSDNPTGAWNLYLFGPYVGSIPDYPAIGVTDDKLTISYNLFDSVFLGFIGEQTLIVQKSDVMAGVAADTFFFAINPLRFTVRPAHHLSPGADQYLTTFDLLSGGGFLPLLDMTVIRVTGTPDGGDVTEASATDLPVLPQDIPPSSVTAGPGSIDSGDFRMLEAVWRDDSLWSSASAACLPPGDTGVRSCAHLIEVETVGAPSVVQDIMFGAVNQYYSWPAIRTDASNNLHVSFAGTHAGMFASAQVAGRLATDPPGTMTGSCLLKAGETVHGSGRWGDYLGAAVDPANPSTVWVVGEYAKTDGFIHWGTYVGSLSYSKPGGSCPQKLPPPPPPPNDNFANAFVIPEPLPYTNTETTLGSTLELGEPQPCSGIASTVWYSFTPSVGTILDANTFGSSYDTVLAAYTGSSLGTLTNQGCNDDTSGPQSELTFTAAAGVTYYFQAGGYFGSVGSLTLNLSGTPCPDLDGDGLCNDLDPEADGDGCPNVREQQTAIGSETTGGRRDYLNPWDYFNPTHDGKNRSDDISKVVSHYHKDQYLPSPPNPPNTPNPLYDPDTDRSAIGPNPWNLGPPDGVVRAGDILSIVRQYHHDCP